MTYFHVTLENQSKRKQASKQSEDGNGKVGGMGIVEILINFNPMHDYAGRVGCKLPNEYIK